MYKQFAFLIFASYNENEKRKIYLIDKHKNSCNSKYYNLCFISTILTYILLVVVRYKWRGII